MNDFFSDSGFLDLSETIDKDTEFIPLISPEEEDEMNKEKIPSKLSILPLKNNVLFPDCLL